MATAPSYDEAMKFSSVPPQYPSNTILMQPQVVMQPPAMMYSPPAQPYFLNNVIAPPIPQPQLSIHTHSKSILS